MFVQIGKYWINLDNINYIEGIEGNGITYNVIFTNGTQLEIGYWLDGDFAVDDFFNKIKKYKTFDMHNIMEALIDAVNALEDLQKTVEKLRATIDCAYC